MKPSHLAVFQPPQLWRDQGAAQHRGAAGAAGAAGPLERRRGTAAPEGRRS